MTQCHDKQFSPFTKITGRISLTPQSLTMTRITCMTTQKYSQSSIFWRADGCQVGVCCWCWQCSPAAYSHRGHDSIASNWAPICRPEKENRCHVAENLRSWHLCWCHSSRTFPNIQTTTPADVLCPCPNQSQLLVLMLWFICVFSNEAVRLFKQ